MSSVEGIRIEVQEGDVLKFPADILVLKYAQTLYGADLAVYERLSQLGRQPESLPEAGGTKLIPTWGLMGSGNVLFIGVLPLHQFGYKQIREFGRKALASLAHQGLRAGHLALTIHGAGYGLDETEAFQSELAGVIDAIVAGDCPADLRQVSFVERNPGRAQRLQDLLKDLIPRGAIHRGGARALEDLAEQPKDTLSTAGYDSATKPRVFVAMPFDDSMKEVFYKGIQGAVSSAGFLCERADLSTFVGDVVEWVKQRISSAELVVADLTTANPNVYLEVGYAWGCGRPTVLIVRNDVSELKFNVQGQRCLVYKSSEHLAEILGRELSTLAAAS